MPVTLEQYQKSGFCDGILGRPASSPLNWKDAPVYLSAYMNGKQRRQELGITVIYERLEK